MSLICSERISTWGEKMHSAALKQRGNQPGALFDLHRVSVSYGSRPALRGITLRIQAGERIALIGPSGAGKTTLLNKLYEMRTEKCAFVHQQYALVPQLSVFHNIYIGRLDRRPTWVNLLNLLKPQKKPMDDVLAILNTLGMTEKLFEKVGALSGGQQQRVAVGRAMYRGSNVLLADEPVASIDPLQGEAILDLITAAGHTVIMALHSVAFARRFSRRIIGLCAGRIRFDRPASQLRQEEIDGLYLTC
jgi:phosphonate transport system ATP-binding protein